MLLAWDNTNSLNWGGRSAHVATYQLLNQDHDVECLPKTYQTQARPVNFSLPEWLSRPLRRRRDRFQLAQMYVDIERFFGARLDYLDPEPTVSKRLILENIEDERLGALHAAVRRHDTVVIDGNGAMIFKEEPKRNLLCNLALIELARHYEKEVYYVNSIFSDCPVTGRNEALADRCVRALKKCKAVSFRDPRSAELAGDMAEGLDVERIPDSLFYWHGLLQQSRRHLPANGDFVIPFTRERGEYYGQLNFDAAYACVTGGSRAAFSQKRAFQGYCELVEKLRHLDLPVYLVPTCYGDRFLEDVAAQTGAPLVPAEVPVLMGGAILANARLFVTGRYHPAIMAASGGTPSVFLGADSHKTSSLQHLLGYDEPHTFSAIPSPAEQDAILARGRALIDRGQPLRDDIQQAAQKCAREATRLTTFVNGSEQ